MHVKKKPNHFLSENRITVLQSAQVQGSEDKSTWPKCCHESFRVCGLQAKRQTKTPITFSNIKAFDPVQQYIKESIVPVLISINTGTIFH